MKAIKENKEYTVDEVSKEKYLAMGYDIVDDNGSVLERSPKSTVSYGEYAKLLEENQKLFEENAKLKTETKAKKG